MKREGGSKEEFELTSSPRRASSTARKQESETPWDDLHVKLPCAPQNIDSQGNPLWHTIQKTLDPTRITNSHQFKLALSVYSPYKFSELEPFFEYLEEKERDEFFGVTLPFIIEKALKIPRFKKQFPLLEENKKSEFVLSQSDICCLLANGFLCTFPGSNPQDVKPGQPFMNFGKLYDPPTKNMKFEKLRCFISYFRSLKEHMPTGRVTYIRHVVHSFPPWSASRALLSDLTIHPTDTIEEAKNALKVNFANATVGGGVLGNGCAQEEISHAIFPELTAGRLFTPQLKDNEAWFVRGAQRYSKTIGYSDSFKWVSPYHDSNPSENEIISIDALDFTKREEEQYTEQYIRRELNKAYTGFSAPTSYSEIATGNWGCGVFKGDRQLKCIIQWMAASQLNKVIHFKYVGNSFSTEFSSFSKILKERKVSCGQLYSMLLEYNHVEDKKETSLFEFCTAQIEKHN